MCISLLNKLHILLHVYLFESLFVCFTASDNEEDESKKPRIAPQIAIACGACAALVIIVSGVVVVLRTHFQIQDSS